jgi:hypothetical protein
LYLQQKSADGLAVRSFMSASDLFAVFGAPEAHGFDALDRSAA